VSHTETTCQHHWLIAEASGPTSPGTCRHCGETRTFNNSTPDVHPYASKARVGRPKKRDDDAWLDTVGGSREV